MNSRDLNAIQGVVKTQPRGECILTGRPGNLTPIRLRRMVVTPVFWIGWNAEIQLPLAKPRSLVLWQYLRMLRPYLLLFLIFVPTIVLKSTFIPNRGEVGNALIGGGTLISGLGLWFGLEWLLNRYEFVRLLSYNNSKGTINWRFSTPELAERAKTTLVLENERAQLGIGYPERIPTPLELPTRRFIRIIAVVSAGVLFLCSALLFVADTDENKTAAVVLLVVGLLLAAAAARNFGRRKI